MSITLSYTARMEGALPLLRDALKCHPLPCHPSGGHYHHIPPNCLHLNHMAPPSYTHYYKNTVEDKQIQM